ncbi:LacI family DNA-binding transcriptional regulator [Dyadobacter sandarakinus]|uniref:LacI family DNA-binding transcriptional regulator n=1 Tax=Dyadobacter sandarakinus TaxID=2747268 RepID=A0ABX7I7X6_9BACT|nr:LacI family DNA-binding transcriptional regulator [Dyadobacter sandarakinus]QRR01278.1 LacI family DNA-binding transcriptional regulator [Dyadobacter sandarakinus]
MRKRYTTIKDIAKALNISVATVSRALRDKYDVSAATRESVLEVARQMNYKPNFNATGLVQQSTHNIGVIIPTITNYYFSSVITGIQEVAWESNFNIVLYITNDLPEVEMKIAQNLSGSSLDGILACVAPRENDYPHFEEMIGDGLPVVFFDRVARSVRTSKVMQDDYNGAFTAVEHLIERGYRKIAHITSSKQLLLTENRLSGYYKALEKHDLPAIPELLVHSGFSQQDGERDVARLFDNPGEKPDAIFAVNDRKGIGAIQALKKRGITVGREVGVIGFTNDPISEIISPSLSTIAEPACEIGKTACQLLLKHIRKSNFTPEELTLSCELIVRESTNR